MKKCLLLLVAVFSLLAFNACKDDEVKIVGPVVPPVVPDEPEVNTPNYLIMFYAVGGGNLDSFILSNILQSCSEGTDDKVKMTFEYKLSSHLQQLYDNFKGTRRFTADDNKNLIGRYQEFSKIRYMLTGPGQEAFLNTVKSEQIGDSEYNMSSTKSLADFIKWSKQQYPDAKRTILIISGHGDAWKVSTEGAIDAGLKTRGMLMDNNFTPASYLTLNETVEGIKQGGGVDMFYTEACLMSMYENIYAYSSVAKYLITAVETTPSLGGDYKTFLQLLKGIGNTDQEFEEAMHKYVDACTSADWWGSGKKSYNDLAFYNLSKLNQVTPVLKKITETLVEKYKSEESVNPTATDLPWGDRFAPYIRQAVLGCEVANSKEEINILSYEDLLPEGFKNALETDADVVHNEYNTFLLNELIDWLRFNETPGAKKLWEKDPDKCNALITFLSQQCKNSYIITDMMRVLDNQLDAVGAQNNPFKALRKELVAAVKSMGYIKCSILDEKPGIDQAYDLCTPGVTIIPLTEEYYNDKIYSKITEELPQVNDAVKSYQTLEFDKQVGWSKFLQTIDVIPSAMTNPTRKFVH